MTTAMEPDQRPVVALRAACFIDAVVFLSAAAQNFGATIPLGVAELSFPVPIWQAGVGEAAIGLTLLAAAATGRATLAWVAFWMSAVGIAFGLSSSRVQGPAREIHIILVPLAVVVFGLLMWLRLERRPSDRDRSIGAARVALREESPDGEQG